jgi:N6-L-threonylcarbamoyladenine synthase
MLGIETSCDETAAALVEDTADARRPWRIRSNVVASQVEIHREWGGVVPELASRQHVRDICGVVERALADGGAAWADVGAVAVTQGPGLVGSLLVGVSFAKSAAWALGVPVVPVHHLAGHIESIWLEHGPVPLPAIVLVVSGGHTSLYLVPREGEYRLVGRTRDDAAGEAYDKVAKLLGLGYPGGPLVDRLSNEGRADRFALPATRLTHPDRNAPDREYRFDFSFSGVKTAVLRHVRHRQQELGVTTLPEQDVRDLCAAFQRIVVETLLRRTFKAARWFQAASVGIAGGVSANRLLRAEAVARGRMARMPVFVPPLALSTDNAAMIAAAGLRAYAAGRVGAPNLNAVPNLALTAVNGER